MGGEQRNAQRRVRTHQNHKRTGTVTQSVSHILGMSGERETGHLHGLLANRGRDYNVDASLTERLHGSLKRLQSHTSRHLGGCTRIELALASFGYIYQVYGTLAYVCRRLHFSEAERGVYTARFPIVHECARVAENDGSTQFRHSLVGQRFHYHLIADAIDISVGDTYPYSTRITHIFTRNCTFV